MSIPGSIKIWNTYTPRNEIRRRSVFAHVRDLAGLAQDRKKALKCREAVVWQSDSGVYYFCRAGNLGTPARTEPVLSKLEASCRSNSCPIWRIANV